MYIHLIRAALLESPSTVRELSTVLKMPTRKLQMGMCVLLIQGHVRKGRAVWRRQPGKGHRWLTLYNLTARGTAVARMQKRLIRKTGRTTLHFKDVAHLERRRPEAMKGML